MNCWIIHAVVFGVIVSKADGIPWKTNPASTGGINGFNPMFEFMNRCSGANLDTDSCLVMKTLDALMGTGGSPPSTPPPSTIFPTTTAPPSRFLQEECPGAPDITEEAFRFMMGETRAECDMSGISISDQEFESVVNGFMTIFGSESCFQQLCEGSSVVLIEIMFDQVAECAQVQPDMPQCLRNGLFEMMQNGAENGQRKLQGLPGCQGPSEAEIMSHASFLLEGAMAKCSELGEPVSQTQLEKTTADLVSILAAANHCLGNNFDCEEGTNGNGDHHDDDYHNDDCMQNNKSGLNSFNIAVKYIEQCADLDLNTDTCLASKTLDALLAGPVPTNPHNDQSFGHRFLQTSSNGNACIPPELDESMLRLVVEGSKQQCFATAQEVEETLLTFMSLFGAQDCWANLCEEQSNPSEALIGIMLQEIGQCAGADLSFNPCLLNQILGLISSSDSPDDVFDGVRRKLQVVLGESDEPADPWAEQPNEDQVRFFIGLMLAGAQEKCIEMGETFAVDEVAKAESELFKLFEARHCWGIPSDCSGEGKNDFCDDDNSGYLGFVKHSTTWMLGQCVDVDDFSCVFSRSIDVMHGMRLLGWSHNGHPDPNRLQLDPDFSSICMPPTLIEYDIDQIAAHAQTYCIKSMNGSAQDADQYNQTVQNLKNLVARNDCWEDLCQTEMRDVIAEEWMNSCASTDLTFLTTQDQYLLKNEYFGEISLDIERLRCMAEFIAYDTRGPNESLTCSLPRLGLGVCGLDSGRAAYIHCGGEVNTPPSPSPSPSPPPSSSMSFSMGYNWAHFEELDMSFTYDQPNDDGFSMQYDDWFVNDDRDLMIVYIGEVCSLIASLQSQTSKCCIKPVCDGLWIEDALAFGHERDFTTLSPTEMVSHSPSPSIATDDSTSAPTPATTIAPSEDVTQSPSPSFARSPSNLPTSDSPATPVPSTKPTSLPSNKPTPLPSIKPSSLPSIQPTSNSTIMNSVKMSSVPTTSVPTQEPTLPTNKPTSKPTEKLVEEPTPSPTNMKYGEIEVSFECEVKLEGIKITEIDIKNLNEVVYLLASIFSKFLPKGAIVRILSVGGISVVRRLLRSLQGDSTGVDIQFEIVLKEQCDSATCDNSAEMSKTLYQDVTSNLKAKVESGELTTSIQEAADSSGVPALANASVNASSLQVDAATVTVTKAPETPSKPNSAPTHVGAACATLAFAVALSTILLSWP